MADKKDKPKQVKKSQFDKDLQKHLKLAQKEIVGILRKLKKPSLDYNVQFALDSVRPNMVEYSVWIQPPADRINRLSWIGTNFDDLLEQLKTFEDSTSDLDVEIAYHGAQILACQETIAHHEEEIKKLKEEKEKEDGNIQ